MGRLIDVLRHLLEVLRLIRYCSDCWLDLIRFPPVMFAFELRRAKQTERDVRKSSECSAFGREERSLRSTSLRFQEFPKSPSFFCGIRSSRLCKPDSEFGDRSANPSFRFGLEPFRWLPDRSVASVIEVLESVFVSWRSAKQFIVWAWQVGSANRWRL